MRLSPLLAALMISTLLWSSVGRAQTVTGPVTVEAPDSVDFNIENCVDAKSFSFAVTFQNTTTYQFQSGAPYEVWLSRGSACSATDSDPDNLDSVACLGSGGDCCEKLQEGTVTLDASGSYELTVSGTEISIEQFFDCASGESGEFKLRAFVQPGYEYELSLPVESDEWVEDSVSVEFDFDRPGAPTLTDLTPGESSIEVTWDPPSGEDLDDITFRAYASTTAFESGVSIEDQSGTLVGLENSTTTAASATTATVSGLLERTEYHVVAVAIDDAGNESFPSIELVVSTVEVADFYELYREGGGGDPGGYCGVADNTSPGRALLGLLLLLPLLLLGVQRRRAPVRLKVFGLAALVLAGVAAAPRLAAAESARSMTTGISMGSYLPAIDDEFDSSAGTGPYKQFFGDEAIRLWRLGVGWHLIQGYGTLSMDFGLSFGSVTGNGVIPDTGERAPEESKLRIVPLSLSLTYALDIFAERYSFPLIPYGSVGLDYVLWWVYDGADEVAGTTSPDGEGQGATYGWHGSLGVRLLLDTLAPDMAQSFDLDMGVNNSYLYVEYLMTQINDFNSDDSFNFSSDALMFGIAFDI